MRRVLAPLLGCMLTTVAPAQVADRGMVPAAAPTDASSSTAGIGWPDAVPGSDLPAASVRRYRMAGRVRPLLFWFGRDDVGMARIVWRRGADGVRGYEMLVGTDPARAPRALNRWGFIAERVDGDDGALLALMTGADGDSYEEASARAMAPGNDLRAIRGEVLASRARWRVSSVRSARSLTLHQLDAAVAEVWPVGGPMPQREMTLERGTRPGFLVAVAELLDLAAAAPPGVRPSEPGPVRYVFGQRLYELRLGTPRRLSTAWAGLRVPSVHASFEIRNLSTGRLTAFEITAGTEGELAGVPLRIQWQPRWWLKVELHLLP